jgi:hypothetical protein
LAVCQSFYVLLMACPLPTPNKNWRQLVPYSDYVRGLVCDVEREDASHHTHQNTQTTPNILHHTSVCQISKSHCSFPIFPMIISVSQHFPVSSLFVFQNVQGSSKFATSPINAKAPQSFPSSLYQCWRHIKSAQAARQVLAWLGGQS